MAMVSSDLDDTEPSDNTDQVNFQVGSLATDLVVNKVSSAGFINAGEFTTRYPNQDMYVVL